MPALPRLKANINQFIYTGVWRLYNGRRAWRVNNMARLFARSLLDELEAVECRSVIDFVLLTLVAAGLLHMVKVLPSEDSDRAV